MWIIQFCRDLVAHVADRLVWLEGALKYLAALVVAAIVALLSCWWAVENTASAPTADAIFALGVATGTAAASFDLWSHFHSRKNQEVASKLAVVATLLTWLGLIIACYSASRSDFESLPLPLAIEFFGLMIILGLLGGWCFASLSIRAPSVPAGPPSWASRRQG